MTVACTPAYTANSAHDVGEFLFPPANLSSVHNCPAQSQHTFALTALVQSASSGLLRQHPPYEDDGLGNILAMSHRTDAGDGQKSKSFAHDDAHPIHR
jgi:hypothetical protein